MTNIIDTLDDRKFCTGCGNPNKISAIFCEKCGVHFVGVDQTENALDPSNLSIAELEQLLVKRTTEWADPQELANINLALAVWYLRKEKNVEAIPYLRKALELDESSAISHAYLGAALAEEFEIENAREELLKALELNPEDAIVHLKYAEFNLKLGLTLDAQNHLEAALHLPLPSLDTKIYVANLLHNTRTRNRRVIERKNNLPGVNLVNGLRKAFKRTETKLES